MLFFSDLNADSIAHITNMREVLIELIWKYILCGQEVHMIGQQIFCATYVDKSERWKLKTKCIC